MPNAGDGQPEGPQEEVFGEDDQVRVYGFRALQQVVLQEGAREDPGVGLLGKRAEVLIRSMGIRQCQDLYERLSGKTQHEPHQEVLEKLALERRPEREPRKAVPLVLPQVPAGTVLTEIPGGGENELFQLWEYTRDEQRRVLIRPNLERCISTSGTLRNVIVTTGRDRGCQMWLLLPTIGEAKAGWILGEL